MTTGDLVRRPAERGAEDWGKTPPRDEEHAFLEGPRNRPLELLWVLRTAGEFLKCFRQLHFVGPCVTVFGWACYAEELMVEQGFRADDPRFAIGVYLNALVGVTGLASLQYVLN